MELQTILQVLVGEKFQVTSAMLSLLYSKAHSFGYVKLGVV